MVYIKSLNGCSPWSRPGSLRLFIFFIFFPPPASHHTPSQFFCTKLGKKHYEILLCCKVSATLNLGIVFPSRLLEVKYLQGIDSKWCSLLAQRPQWCKSSLCSTHLFVCLLKFLLFTSSQKSVHTQTLTGSKKSGSHQPASSSDEAGTLARFPHLLTVWGSMTIAFLF